MHEIPPQALQLLKDQGISDAEIDELRRTGSIQRVSTDGTASISIDGNEVSAVTLDPAMLEKLRRFNRFIPKAARESIEVATGQDIDGDGRIGGAAAAPPSATAHEHVAAPSHDYRPSSAMPQHGATSDGPFVERSARRSFMPWLIFIVAIAGVIWLIAQR